MNEKKIIPESGNVSIPEKELEGKDDVLCYYTRNIGIMSHIDEGKNKGTVRLLYYSGLKHKGGLERELEEDFNESMQSKEEMSTGTTGSSCLVELENCMLEFKPEFERGIERSIKLYLENKTRRGSNLNLKGGIERRIKLYLENKKKKDLEEKKRVREEKKRVREEKISIKEVYHAREKCFNLDIIEREKTAFENQRDFIYDQMLFMVWLFKVKQCISVGYFKIKNYGQERNFSINDRISKSNCDGVGCCKIYYEAGKEEGEKIKFRLWGPDFNNRLRLCL